MLSIQPASKFQTINEAISETISPDPSCPSTVDLAPDMFQVAAKSPVQLDNIEALQGVQVVQTRAVDYQNPTRNS